MALKRREFTREFKLRVVTEAEGGKPMAHIAREHQVNANTVAKWRKQLRQYPDTDVREGSCGKTQKRFDFRLPISK